MIVAVLSDTHAPRFWKSCPPAVAAQLRDVDLILHAGDVCTPSVLDELSAYAPVRAVRDNNDGDDIGVWGGGVPETLEFDLDGLAVAMIHDSGAKQGRLARLHRRFPTARLVVFGHSHLPLQETGTADGVELTILNPGSPTDKRRQPRGTVGRLEIKGGRLISAEIIAVSR